MIQFLILAFIVLVILGWSIFNKEDIDIPQFILVILVAMNIFIAYVLYSDSPKAMDVYMGKTTLEITYRDSVPVDSIVVFKK